MANSKYNGATQATEADEYHINVTTATDDRNPSGGSKLMALMRVSGNRGPGSHSANLSPRLFHDRSALLSPKRVPIWCF